MGRPPKNKQTKIDEIKSRKSKFAEKLMAQRFAAKKRLENFRGTLDTGVTFNSNPPIVDDELETDDSEEGKKIFNEFLSGKPKPSPKLNGEEEKEEEENELDEDEKVNEEKTSSGEPINQFVFSYYQGFKKAGLSGHNAATLTLATILAEIGIILKARLR